ncbi:hypothetical protein DCS_05734 [Drechmeria coniospora]|uniref:Fungal-type protein kinase domain-containing protein n=1 Tax=Drechmeria coniospora TaxID=98403 RepID=A0A151GNM0_DRECN|nr:hypothetical protein DCS_05734 [Drechmeria coniospora]KYK58717.1 hypothetical protein DCS_05734 [Drechmeria coniospora]
MCAEFGTQQDGKLEGYRSCVEGANLILHYQSVLPEALARFSGESGPRTRRLASTYPMQHSIKAHKSLYDTGNILYCNISLNNIIITDPATSAGFKGILVDFDLAKVRDASPDQTGTRQFMAIEVSCNIDHTYRHDLELCFYILL